MIDTVVQLIAVSHEQNDIGELVEVETARTVMATLDDIGRSEFFQASAMEFAPSFVCRTAAINYGGETVLEHDGVRFAIYRTYLDGDTIELYAQKKAGVSYGRAQN